MLMDFAQIWVILKLSLRPKGSKCLNISAVITVVKTAVNLTVAPLKVFGKSYSLENSLRESIFREDLFLYNSSQVGVAPHPLQDDAGRAVEYGALLSREAAFQPDLVPHGSAESLVPLVSDALRYRDCRDPPRLGAHNPGVLFIGVVRFRSSNFQA